MDSLTKDIDIANSGSKDIDTMDHGTKNVDSMDHGTKISLAERMKGYEKTESVPGYQSFIVRTDGNCFSKYTKGFPEPFDIGFSRAMIKTANALISHFNAKTGFVCSDEITLIFDKMCTESEYHEIIKTKSIIPSHIYSGRHNKIESLVASKCSVLFNKFMMEETTPDVKYNAITLQKIRKCDAIFDARIIPIPVGSEIEIVNNIIWRSSYDCYRNTVSAYCRHVVGNKQTVKKNCKEMVQLMKDHGFDFSTMVPKRYKYGVLCKKILVKLVNPQGEEYIRGKEYNFTTNLMEQDRVKTLDLFFEKYYEQKIESEPVDLTNLAH